MAIIVETGLIVPGANSFVSLAEADAYHSLRANAVWAAATEPSRNAALVNAGQMLNTVPWKGKKTHRTNPMSWPRSQSVTVPTMDYSGYAIGVLDGEGNQIGVNEIPSEVKDAQCELALRALSGSLLPDLERGGRVKREKVDVIETEYADNAPAGTSYTIVRALLAGLVQTGNTIQLVRT